MFSYNSLISYFCHNYYDLVVHVAYNYKSFDVFLNAIWGAFEKF